MSDNSKIQVKNMILKQEVIERIKGRTDIKPLLVETLDLHISSINRILNENAPNGQLTTVAAVEVISRLLGVETSEVLTETEKQLEPCTEA